jgi:hypothetical protein
MSKKRRRTKPRSGRTAKKSRARHENCRRLRDENRALRQQLRQRWLIGLLLRSLPSWLWLLHWAATYF